ncbi:replication-associated protein [Dragonfly associated alphasatellite]|uniref:Replication-associated protein n=1 Tax=Dragonfly associated alphasatellite TaxID=2169905 RepID=K7RY10_9VIRU|nr:replication-associated protein [Dragonfly associated alphasatellite]AFV91336.1 replication-associated protein [Dragonfly associated alphasatellite]
MGSFSSPRSRWWCFTLNFSGDPPELAWWLARDEIKYACWQHEKGTHDHMQGYLQLKKPSRLTAVRKLFGNFRPHLEVQKARRAEDARDYCMKDESRVAGPWEIGEFIPQGSHKGRMRDLVRRSPERMAEENPSVYRRVLAAQSVERFRSDPSLLPDPLRDWQICLLELLEEVPDNRSIIWIYGPAGAEGKTMMAKELFRRGWFYTSGGTADNVKYQYAVEVESHVVFDIPRDKKDYIQYSLIEELKNGMIVSNKYEPIRVVRISGREVHVVVMCNFMPDYSKISPDRIVIVYCRKCPSCETCLCIGC